MATPTTLIELEQQRVATWTAEQAAAKASLQAAQSALTIGLAALQVATQEFTDQTNELASLRVKLSSITTPADAAPLLADLQTAIQAQRVAVNAMLVAETTVASAREASDTARSRAQAADKNLVGAQAELAKTQTEQTKRDGAKAAVTQPPLDALAARATALLASAAFTAATTRIETDFPHALRERARDRAGIIEDRAARLAATHASVQALIDSYYSTHGSVSDKVAAVEQALSDAEAALYYYVSRASSRCDAAEAILNRIGDADYPPLTAEEHAAIDDATLLSDREAAATAEADRDTAQEALENAQASYDHEYLKVLAISGADGVTAALADSTSALAQAKDDVDSATTDLAQKQTDFDSTKRALLDTWQTAVPDAAWRDLADFDSAEATLTELTADPAILVTAVTNAETALLNALLALDAEDQELHAYEVALAESADESAVADTLLTRARFSALRGDY